MSTDIAMTASVAFYSTPPTEVTALGLAVTGVGRITGQRAFRARRRLASYAGVLVTSGSGQLTLPGRPESHDVAAGSFFWLPPGVPHSYGPSPGDWSELWVLFEGPAAARYEDLGYLGGGPAVVEPVDARQTGAVFAELLESGAQPESLARHVRASALLHTLICSVGTVRSASTQDEPGRRDTGRRALELLERDAHLPIAIGDIARQLAVSRDTLATAVRELTGSTPTDYRTRLRLNRAKSLLTDTDRPIARIAEDVGYPDPAYFTRIFTKSIGLAPSAFRRQQKP
ncbi:helix-turn-helix domain-containing protein [Catenulispora pinisilvae]|uniref:helix-turn-helix domain-containing protein n=1 Tax=Catenulispora pinisilvae TaxID=2705253 RepID=UPI0018921290|nr:helix-turn-helix domain-containing protein [Catenulispora pinisilvae]